MKKIVLIAALFPFSSWAKFQIPDFVKSSTAPGQVVTLGVDPKVAPLMKKFAEAMKNPELMRDLRAKMKPGEPMPYDKRFGISEADYQILQGGLKNMKISNTGTTTPLTIEKTGGILTVKTPACSLLKDGAKVDLATGSMTLPGRDAIAPSYFMNRTTPIAPADGYQWSSGKTSISVVYRMATRNCILSCDVLDPSHRESAMVQYDCKPASLFKSSLENPVAPAKVAASAPAATLGTSPATSCRASLNRYPQVPPSMMTMCKRANPHSARVVDEYTKIYSGSLSEDLLEALLQVDTQDRSDCAIQIARKFDGSMTTQYFKETCL